MNDPSMAKAHQVVYGYRDAGVIVTADRVHKIANVVA
jgi:hypothetical protein